MLTLLQGCKFSLLQSLLRCLFLLRNLLLCVRSKLLFFSKIIPMWQGELMCGFILNCLHLGCSVHLDLLNHHRIYIYSLKFIITLYIAKHVQQKFSTLSGPPTLRSAPLFGLDTHTNSTIVMME